MINRQQGTHFDLITCSSISNILYFILPMEQFEFEVDPVDEVVAFLGQAVQFEFPCKGLK